MARSITPLDVAESPVTFSDVCLLVVPVATFKEISDQAAANGLTFAQFLANAVAEYRAKLESKPQLLTESP